MIKCPSCSEDNPPKFRLCGYCGTPLASAAPAPAPPPPPPPSAPLLVRKTVTFLFCDLKGSTALGEVLDPEALHEVKERYFAVMAEQITRNGGTIEKYIGDAIMAAFGLPRTREDDALRAVRAALGMQQALVALNQELQASYGVTLANRTGVNTGEVVANHDSDADQKLATGDAVNVAARLEQAAPENEIYIGEITYRLVRDAVVVEPVEPLALKGKAEPVAAYRLINAEGEDGLVRRHDRPLIGREAELAQLRQAYEAVREQRVTRMVTVIGDAGVGKTRLVRAVMESVAADARVLSGRCLSYGEGITYWPLAMIVREAAGIEAGDASDLARAQLYAAADNEAVAERLAAAIGLSTEPYPVGEIEWAARKFLEHLAADAPLVVLVDDIHWAAPAMLGLLEHVLQTAQDAPVLLLCTARVELITDKPDWASTEYSQRCELGPLTNAAAAELVLNLLRDAQLPQALIDRIVIAAAGNPLYAEQMLLMLIDSGALRNEAGRWVVADPNARIEVPPTIQALLETRVDKLRLTERMTVEPAAVIGVEFEQRTLDSLSPDALRSDLPQHLSDLVRKQLIASRGLENTDIVYRFHHHLLRETIYNGMTKRSRSALHVGFVRWVEKHYPDRLLELEEILAYHLEQAFQFLKELGPLNDAGRTLGLQAASRCANAGYRAVERGDCHAAASLLGRAVNLYGADSASGTVLMPDLGYALADLGQFDRARDVLNQAIERAKTTANRRTEALAGIYLSQAQLFSGTLAGSPLDLAERLTTEIVPLLDAEEAHEELSLAWRFCAFLNGVSGRYQQAGMALEQSLSHARTAGSDRLILRIADAFAANDLYGATPVADAIARAEAFLAGGLRDRQVEGMLIERLAQMKAMNAEFSAARELLTRARDMLNDRGGGVFAAGTAISVLRIALRSGDLADVEPQVRPDLDYLRSIGERYCMPTVAALLARLLTERGEHQAAIELAEQAAEAAMEDDWESAMLWRLAKALATCRLGRLQEAQALASAATDLALKTEALVLQADALSVAAEVSEQLGEQERYRQLLMDARTRYAQKGDIASVSRCDARLAAQ